MKIQVYVFTISLLSVVPGLLARSSGAPPEACSTMMPQHGANSQPENVGYYIISDAIDGYTPGENYLGTLVTICVATLNARYHPLHA